MRDGVRLIADRYTPVIPHPLGTVLVQVPYGRRPPYTTFFARVFAERGYQVVLQSNRGTFGSGGTFTPFADDVADAHDTVEWLREQPWFTGTFATIGMSYLGWAQWALLADPPPELVASVVCVGPNDVSQTAYGTGAFALTTTFGWADTIATQENRGWLSTLLVGAVTSHRRHARAMSGLPLLDSAEQVLQGKAPFFADWITHEDVSDEFWQARRVPIHEGNVPILLAGGWSDVFLDQTMKQYETLRSRGANVSLTVGPWNHIDLLLGLGTITQQTLSWLSEHLAGETVEDSVEPVRIFVTGADNWASLPSWPPATRPETWYLRPAGELSHHPAAAPQASTSFIYDPADPTPTVGGRTLNSKAGRRDNQPRESRADVLTFTSDPLETDLEVAGTPTIELHRSADSPFCDVMVRVCEVDSGGTSTNISDAYQRLHGDEAVLRLTADPIHHVFRGGTRVRVQISGGSFPHYDRNLGTGDTVAAGARLVKVTHTIQHNATAASTVTLPVVKGPQ